MQKTTTVLKTDFLHLAPAISILAFFIPFTISGPQWLTGIVINSLLFLYVSKFPKKTVFPVIILPSAGAFVHGVVFGPLTPFLIYFFPFIWMGNYLLVFIFNKTKNRNYFFRIAAASVFKFIVLFSVANIYFRLQFVPKLFITSMGIVQLFTAFTGGILSLIMMKLINKKL